MNKLSFFVLSIFFFIVKFAFAQTPLSGIINVYAKVIDVESCQGVLIVDDATAFEIDNDVIIYQAQGATIEENDNSSFGDVVDIGSAGLFEKATIADITGNTIELSAVLFNEYDPNGNVQIISFPKYDNAFVESTVFAPNWDGNTGGVVALQVENTLTLDGIIDATGVGFRGGELELVNSNCNFLTNANDYFYDSSNWRGAPKGEGLALIISGKERGRGAQANGGGGGNDHNSGGGGGGHFTNGGQGGEQNPSGNFGCDGDFPGVGGKGFSTGDTRIFFGGGGGAGHADNANAGSGGSNGGGIVIITANTIEGAGGAVFARGVNAETAGGDGAGGGGAGGTILVNAQNSTGNVGFDVKGGNGGNTNNPSDRCFGPGGGGAGGRILTTVPDVILTLEGGIPGINQQNSSECNGPSNGAVAGQTGSVGVILEIPEGMGAPQSLAFLTQPADEAICEGETLMLTAEVVGAAIDFQWQVNFGNGFEFLSNGGNISGANSGTLQITNIGQIYDGAIFQLMLTNSCDGTLISDPSTVAVSDSPNALFTFLDQGNGLVQFGNLSSNFTGISWDFGDGNMSDQPNPSHQFDEEGSYLVTLTAEGDCTDVTFTQTVTIVFAPQADFLFLANEICAPITVEFFNESSDNSTNFEWFFEGGNPAFSIDVSPIVIYENEGVFDVTLIATNSSGSDTSFLADAIIVQALPEAEFSFVSSGLVVNFDGTIPGFTGAYNWDFGDGNTDQVPSPTHLYDAAGSFDVTLTITNDCGSNTVSQSVTTGIPPIAAFEATTNGGCAPVDVLFSDQSTGSDITWDWSFPGGNPATSTDQNPIVNYVDPGTYDVVLIVENSLGIDTLELNDYVEVNTFPMAAFEFEINDFTVNFINNSSGGVTFSWSFGDGSPINTAQNPIHTYLEGGLYTVILTVDNGSCSSIISETVFIDPVATNEISTDVKYSVQPNPANTFIQIVGNQLETQHLTWSIYSMRGRRIKSGQNSWIDTSEIPSGVYLLEWSNDIEKGVFKVVIQH